MASLRCLSSSSSRVYCRLPAFKLSSRSFHFSPSSSSTYHAPAFSPFAPLDISYIQNTTLKEISENFKKINIAEPPKTVSIVEPAVSVSIMDPSAKEEIRADSVLKKRRRKMNKHKLKRVRKQQRFLMRKLGK